MTQKDLIAKFGPVAKRVTARKHMGDDAGSWAVFIDGGVFVNGLTAGECWYYKTLACETIMARAAKKAGGTVDLARGEAICTTCEKPGSKCGCSPSGTFA